MLSNKFSGKLWPIHMKPKPDELLTSWLVRLSIAHGLNMFGFFSGAFPHLKIQNASFWQGDPDKFIMMEMLEVLASKTNTPIEQVIVTTLAAYEGVICENYSPYGNSIWILPILGTRRPQRLPGLQFCPACLAEDEEPYYRRSWRLAFVALCVKHKAPLLDRCAKCGSSVVFHRLLVGHHQCDLPSYSITSCYSCKADLRDSTSKLLKQVIPISDEEIAFQGLLMDVVNKGWIDITGTGPIYSHLFFAVLRRLMMLFSGGRRAYGIRESASKRYGIENFVVSYRSTKNQYIEFLNVRTRCGLLNMSRQLLREWPNEFIDFCQANRIWRQTLLKSFPSAPFWFWKVVNEHLSHINYKPNEEEIVSAFQCMDRLSQEHKIFRPYRYSEKMKAVAKFLRRVQCVKYRSTTKLPNMQLKSSWRRNGWAVKDTSVPFGPKPIRLIPDALWSEVEKLLPPPSLYPGGKKRGMVDMRRLLNGMLYILCTDTTWDLIPAEFCSPSYANQKYHLWKKSGVFDKIWPLCSSLYE